MTPFDEDDSETLPKVPDQTSEKDESAQALPAESSQGRNLDRNGSNAGVERSIFLNALEIEDEVERNAYLGKACEGAPGRRERIEKLLQVESRNSFLTPGETVKQIKAVALGSAKTSPEVAHYDVGAEIARGGMGSIREAWDTKLKRTVAIKVMHWDAAASPAAQARFVLEAEVLAHLEHPNIVPIHDIVWEGDKPLFYSMKLVKGRTLQAILNDLRNEVPEEIERFTLDRLLGIFRKVCDAIAFAHSQGVIHRDLKPENIMVGEFGEVLVMDWGIAKRLGQPGDANAEGVVDEVATPQPESLVGTMQGDVMGTPQYMSPEQAAGKIEEIEERSDVYSLGGILYAVLTLRPPVEGKTLQEVLEKVSSGAIEAPTGMTGRLAKADGKNEEVLEAALIRPLPHTPGGRVPPALSSVVMKALSLKKRHRYESVRDLEEDIEKWQTGFATSAETISAAGQVALFIRRHKGISTAVGVAAIVVAALTTGFVIKVNQEKELAETEAANARAAEAVATEKEAETSRALARSRISLAEACFQAGDIAGMGSHLLACPEEYRDEEWAYLMTHADNSRAISNWTVDWDTKYAPHPVHPDQMVVADPDPKAGGIRFLDVPGEKEVRRLDVSFDGTLWAVAVDRAGEQIAIGIGDRVRVLRESDGGRISEFSVHSESFSHLDFSSDGELIAMSGSETEQGAAIYRVSSGELVRDLGKLSHIRSFRSRRGWTAQTGAAVVEIDELGERKVLVPPQKGGVRRHVALDDGLRVLHTDSTSEIQLSRSGEDRPLWKTSSVLEEVLNIDLLGEGERYFAVYGLDIRDNSMGEIRAVADGGLLQVLSGETSKGFDPVVSSGGRWLFSQGRGEAPERWWPIPIPELILSHPATIRGFGFGPGEKYWSDPGPLNSCPVNSWSGQPNPELPGSNWRNITLSVNHLGDRIVALKRVELYQQRMRCIQDTSEGFQIREGSVEARLTGRKAMTISPDGRHVAVGLIRADDSRGWAIYEFDTVRKTAEVHRDLVWYHSIMFFGDSSRLATLENSQSSDEGSRRHVVGVWNLSGDLIAETPLEYEVTSWLPNPGGPSLVLGCGDNRVRFVTGDNLEVVHSFRAHDGPVTCMAFDEDHRILVTGSTDLTVKFWDAKSYELLATMIGCTSPLENVDFLREKEVLGTVTKDEIARIWDVSSLGVGESGTR